MVEWIIENAGKGTYFANHWLSVLENRSAKLWSAIAVTSPEPK